MIFLQLDHEVLGSNRGTLAPLEAESSGTSKASKLVSSKEQVNLIREKECSVWQQVWLRVQMERILICCDYFSLLRRLCLLL